MFGSAAQHLQQEEAPGSSSQPYGSSDYNPFLDPHRNNGRLGIQQPAQPTKELDLVFVSLTRWCLPMPRFLFPSLTSHHPLSLAQIMDATGSMGSYIASATKNIETICDNIIQSEQLSTPGALRIGLVAFRDHPPQDYSFVTKEFPFTSDVSEIKDHLKTLYATGGGDGPEAVTAAMRAVLDLQWRSTATRLAVLIADAPPHGIGEYGDGFPHGSPEGSDPLVLARLMAQSGISLFMVACEPALSSYSHAADFYQGIVRITAGLLVPLTTASLLTHVIIAAASEAMALDRLHREVGDEVAERLRTLSLEGQQNNASSANDANSLMDEVARDLHQRLLLRNESTKQLVIESIYRESEESRSNIQVWSTARDLESAKPLIRKVSSVCSVPGLKQNPVLTPFEHSPGTWLKTIGQLLADSQSQVELHHRSTLPFLALKRNAVLVLVRILDHCRRRFFSSKPSQTNRHQRLLSIHRSQWTQCRLAALGIQCALVLFAVTRCQ